MSSHELLLLALKEKETLIRFCYDHLPEVYNQFAAEMTHEDRTHHLGAYLADSGREPEQGTTNAKRVRSKGIFALGVVFGGLIVFVTSLLLQFSASSPDAIGAVEGANVTSSPSTATQPVLTSTSTSVDCTPSNLSEMPPQTIAFIESLEGIESRAPLSTLRYEHQSGLRLASGITVDFNQMQRFTLSNPSFTGHFGADVEITRLDCRLVRDRIRSESGSFLTAETEIGPLELHILKVKRVNFQW